MDTDKKHIKHTGFLQCEGQTACQLCHNNLIDTRRQVIWMFMPKVATISVRYAIHDNPGYSPEIGFRRWHPMSWIEKSNYADFFKIGFIRNPYARLISCWVDKVHNRLHRTFPAYGINEGDSFDVFVRRITNVDDHLADKHWRPMSFEYIKTDKETPDYICKLENMSDDWKKLMGIPALKDIEPISHHHKSRHHHYRYYYNDETRSLVSRYYAKDLEMFGYEF